MNRIDVFGAIEVERNYQDRKWGTENDALSTPNDWLACIAMYTGKAYSIPFNENQFRRNLVKVAALVVAALEQEHFASNSLDAARL